MPRVHKIGNAKIYIYLADHNPPHFHVIAPDWSARVALSDLRIIDDNAPPSALRPFTDWAANNLETLWAVWAQCNETED
jgi:hypothetical protein